ncbi:MAG TPA: helix-turn-helix domain-containing protein [Streptosporangiaceae bacterium]|jgi:DNA-binding PucR family transcriptional regulator
MRHENGSVGRAAQSLAERAVERLPALTDALVRTIQEENPGYRIMAVVPRDDLWRSCHDNIARVLELIAHGVAESGTDDTDERFDVARATGRRRAEQQMPLDDVLRSFRLGGRLVWEALIEQAHADNLADTDGLLDVATRVWEVVDATSAQVAAAYRAAEASLLRADAQRMAALWEGLLHGRAKDTAYAHEVSRVLGVPVEGSYVVVLADAGAGTNATQLAQLLAAQGIVSAWQVRADSLVGLLALPQPVLDETLGVLREVLTTPAGVSLVAPGLVKVDTAYRQAALARRTILGDRAEVAALEERLVDALLLSSPELASQLVHRWLGDLLAIAPAERGMLLGTLQIWVATGGSIKDTADAAFCHRNTVINRLQRMQAITGHDFADPSCLAEVKLALRAAGLLPSPPPTQAIP